VSQESSTTVNHLQELVKNFTVDQLRYLAVRPFVRYDKEAAAAIGLAAETVCRWENKADVDEAIKLMIADGIIVAAEILRRYVPQAATELVEELADSEVGMRHRAAKEVLDRGGLPAKQQMDVTSGGKPLFDLDKWKQSRQDRLSEADEIE